MSVSFVSDGTGSKSQRADTAVAVKPAAATGQCGIAINIAMFVFIAVIILAIALPLSAFKRSDAIAAERLRIEAITEPWCGALEEMAGEGRAAVAQLAGVAHGANTTHAPPYADWNEWPVTYQRRVDSFSSMQNATWASRLSPIWYDATSNLAKRYPNLRVARLEPLGLIAQWYPIASQASVLGFDTRTYDANNCTIPDDSPLVVRPAVTIGGVLDTSIIFTRTLTYRGECSDAYLLQRRAALGVTSPAKPRACNVDRCWWGFARASISLAAIMAVARVNETALANGLWPAVTLQDGWMPYYPLNRTNDSSLWHIVNVSRFHGVSCDFAGMTLHVSSPVLEIGFANPGRTVDPEAIIWSVVGAVLGGLLVVVVANIVAALWDWARNPIRYAPRQAPIAIVAAEIALHGDLWDEAPVAAASVLASVAEMVHEQAKEHEAYVAGSTGHGYLIVADRPDKALHFMREFNEELSRAVFQSEEEPSKAGKRRSQGGKQLVLAHAKMVAHFGDDVSIAVNVASKTAAYGGADVTLTRALLASAPPDADMYVTSAFGEIVKMAAAVPSATSRSQECARCINDTKEVRVDTRFGSSGLLEVTGLFNNSRLRALGNSRSLMSDSTTSPQPQATSNLSNAPTGKEANSTALSSVDDRHAVRDSGEEMNAALATIHRVCEDATSAALKNHLRDSLVAEPAAVQRNFAALVTCAEYFHEAIVMVLSPFRMAEADAVSSSLRRTFGLPQSCAATQPEFVYQLASRISILRMRHLLAKASSSSQQQGSNNTGTRTHRGSRVTASRAATALSTANPLGNAFPDAADDDIASSPVKHTL